MRLFRKIADTLPKFLQGDDLIWFGEVSHPALSFHLLIKQTPNILKLFFEESLVSWCERGVYEGDDVKLIDETINLQFGIVCETYFFCEFSIFLSDNADPGWFAAH